MDHGYAEDSSACRSLRIPNKADALSRSTISKDTLPVTRTGYGVGRYPDSKKPTEGDLGHAMFQHISNISAAERALNDGVFEGEDVADNFFANQPFGNSVPYSSSVDD